MNWTGKQVLVTGGLGFIGSTLVDALLTRGAEVTVADKVFSPSSYIPKLRRTLAIYEKHGAAPQIENIDLACEFHRLESLCKGKDAVFHLAALFGGREFVDTRQADCARMFAVDHSVIEAASRAGVEKFAFASSACVYPDSLQGEGSRPLREEDALSVGNGWKSWDNLYGMAKLAGELQCKVYHDERGLKTSACRYLTVYGPGEMDATHAVAALIEKALSGQDPLEVWGSGKQERGFTFVDDIVEGTILACEKVEDGTPVNLGWEKRYDLDAVASLIISEVGRHYDGWNPSVTHLLDKPEGPRSRALDISRARALLGWEPKVDLSEGIARTVAWHRTNRSTG